MEKNFVEIALQYAKDVVSGVIPACKWVKLACKRQLNDLEKPLSDGWPWVFDKNRATRVCVFIELFPHIKGQWARDGQLIELEPWQCFIVVTVFGWVHFETGLRRFQEAYNEIPRKNAKSTLSSAISLYMLTADGEQGAEIYSAATKKEQAKIVFDVAAAMASRSSDFRYHLGVDVWANSITQKHTESKYEPLAADSKSLDGLNVHCGILDELHAHKTRKVYDVIDTGRGAREQSLLWNITTAGDDLSGICFERRSHVTKVLEGVVDDQTLFGIIYTIDDEDRDNWHDEKVWIKANPNYGISVMPEYMRAAAAKAKSTPSALFNFLTKHLDVWVNSGSAWLHMQDWRKCCDPTLSLDDFRGEPCWIGLDLAEKRDFVALLLVFFRDGDMVVFSRFYLNEVAVAESSNAQLRGWCDQGFVTVTDGNITDFDVVAADLDSYCEMFDVQEIDYDPAKSEYFARKLLEKGLPMVSILQRAIFFNQAILQTENFVIEGKFLTDGNPVMTWMISNLVVLKSKYNGLRQPVKDRPENKIDGPVAMFMAAGRALFTDVTEESVYEQRGIRSV